MQTILHRDRRRLAAWATAGVAVVLFLVLAAPSATDVLGQTAPSLPPGISTSAAPGATVPVGDATVTNETNVPLALRRAGAQLFVSAAAGTTIQVAGAACQPASGAGNDAICTVSSNVRLSVSAVGVAAPPVAAAAPSPAAAPPTGPNPAAAPAPAPPAPPAPAPPAAAPPATAPINPPPAAPALIPDAPSVATTGARPPAPGVARPVTPAQIPSALPRTGTGLHVDKGLSPVAALVLMALLMAVGAGLTLTPRRGIRWR